MHIVNVNPRGDDLLIEPTNQYVPHGENVDVPDEIGEALLKQEGEWAKPGTKAAKAASSDKEEV